MSKTVEDLENALADITNAAIDATEHEMRVALLLLCASVRALAPEANFIALCDSDQGDWASYLGAAVSDDDVNDDNFLAAAEDADDVSAAFHFYDSHYDLLLPYLAREGVGHRSPWSGAVVDIERVLADEAAILAASAPVVAPEEITVMVVDDGSGPMAVDPFSTRADALAALRLNHTDGDTDAPDDDEDLPRYLTDHCGYVIHLETVPFAAWLRSAR